MRLRADSKLLETTLGTRISLGQRSQLPAVCTQISQNISVRYKPILSGTHTFERIDVDTVLRRNAAGRSRIRDIIRIIHTSRGIIGGACSLDQDRACFESCRITGEWTGVTTIGVL